MRIANWIWALAILGLLAGCVSVKAPEGYAEHKGDRRYDFKAVSVDASVFTLRAIDNDDKDNGTMNFWSRAVRKQLEESRGYVFKESGAFQSGQGPGQWMLFSRKYKGTDYLYLVGVVVDGDDIYVMEGTGQTAVFEKDLPKIRKALETLD